MVELARAGRSASELSREFGPHVTSILSWVGKAHAGGQAGGAPTASQDAQLCAAERQELVELRRKLRQVQMERDILAKATAWFANNGEQTYTPSTR